MLHGNRPRPSKVSYEQIAEVCDRNQVGRLSIYQSPLTQSSLWNCGPVGRSLPLVVEFLPDACTSLSDLAVLEKELAAILDYPVTLRLPAELCRLMRQTLKNSTQTLYIQTSSNYPKPSYTYY